MRGASQIPDPLLEAVDGIAVGRWRLSETGAATAHGTVRFCDNGKRKEAVSGDGLFCYDYSCRRQKNVRRLVAGRMLPLFHDRGCSAVLPASRF